MNTFFPIFCCFACWGAGIAVGMTIRYQKDTLAIANRPLPSKTREERLEKALRELVKVNKDWNADVAKIVTVPPSWNDSYLDAAREALSHE